MPGVARSGALCMLPAPTHADTCLRLGAVLQARLAHVVRHSGASSVPGAIVSGTVVSGTVVVGTVSTVLSSPGPALCSAASLRVPAAEHAVPRASKRAKATQPHLPPLQP